MKYEYAYGIDKHCKSLQKRAMMPKSAQGGVLKYPCQAQSKQNDPAPHNTILNVWKVLYLFSAPNAILNTNFLIKLSLVFLPGL